MTQSSYFSITSQGRVHEFADSQFGHLFSNKKNRDQAISHLVIALSELCVNADFRTTTEYLVELLEHHDFQNNSFSTAWLDSLLAAKQEITPDTLDKPLPIKNVISAACIIADKIFEQSKNDYIFALQRGQVPASDSIKVSTEVDLVHHTKRFKFHVCKISDHGLLISNLLAKDNNSIEVETHRLSDGGLLANFNDSNNTVYLREEADSFRVTVNNKVTVFTKETDPSILKSPTAGKLIKFLVKDGEKVTANQIYAEIEVMKMTMNLMTAAAGTFHQEASAGTAIVGGAVLGRLTEMETDSNSSTSLNIEDYTGKFIDDLPCTEVRKSVDMLPRMSVSNEANFPTFAERRNSQQSIDSGVANSTRQISRPNGLGLQHSNSVSDIRPSIKKEVLNKQRSLETPKTNSSSLSPTDIRKLTKKPHHLLEEAEHKILACLKGFCYPSWNFTQEMEKAINNLLIATKERTLPLYELQDIMNRSSNTIPSRVVGAINKEANNYRKRMGSLLRGSFPSSQIKNVINKYAAMTPE